jgi:hypothetical protein
VTARDVTRLDTPPSGYHPRVTFRGLGRAGVAVLLAISWLAWFAAPAVSGPPVGGGGGCGQVTYNRVGGGVAVRSLCSVPGGSVFQGGGGGGGSDPGCPFRRPKTFPDGTYHIDPDNPQYYIMEDAFGLWDYVELSTINQIPYEDNPPPGLNDDQFMAWVHSYPTYQDNAGGNRVFGVLCEDPTASTPTEYGGYPNVSVGPNDPFWGDLPGQLDALAARIHLATPSLAFTPGGPDVWGGFLTNAPYGVILGNDGIWHPVHAQDVDALGAWRLSVVASPVTATVIVKRGNSTESMDCAIGVNGPVPPAGLPRFDPPAAPVNLPPCAFTARWAQATSVSVSMRITYRVVGFIGTLVAIDRTETTTSAVQTWPVIRAEAVNTDGN